MANFIFKCPVTGFNVQHELDDDPDVSRKRIPSDRLSCLRPVASRQPKDRQAVRVAVLATVRTSVSLRTLQEQTIIGSPLTEIPMSALSPKGDGDVRLVPNKRPMHGSNELKLFDHFVGAGEGKMRDCNLSLMQPEHAVDGVQLGWLDESRMRNGNCEQGSFE
jgi:hypothetical protein